MLALLSSLGADVEWLGANEVRVQAQEVGHEIDEELASRIRASFLLAGPLLARHGRVSVPPPGGDVIGRRRLDPHIHAFAELGAKLEYDGRYELSAAACRRAHPSRRGVGDGDRERRHGRGDRAGPHHDLECRQRAARAGPLPVPELARRQNRRCGFERAARRRCRAAVRWIPFDRSRAHRGRQLHRHGRRHGRRPDDRGIVPDDLWPVLPVLRRLGIEVELGDDWVRVPPDQQLAIRRRPGRRTSRKSRTGRGRHSRPT